jgi:hypothetical protein
MPPKTLTKKNATGKSTKAATKTKKGRQKEVVYDILTECAALMRDEFWKQFYEDLAVGKSTKGIYITNGTIHTSNKRNGFTYSITDKAPEVIVAELHHLLISHTSICSKKDMNKKRQFVQEIEEELNAYDEAKWTSIKRKNVRNMLLVDYAVYLNKVHDLSWPATINAYRTIISAFENKTHASRDVEYENGKILSIDGIELSEDETCIINTRQDRMTDSVVAAAEPDDGAILLQSLFDPYIAAWIKMIKT